MHVNLITKTLSLHLRSDPADSCTMYYFIPKSKLAFSNVILRIVIEKKIAATCILYPCVHVYICLFL